MENKILTELIKDLRKERQYPILITTDLFWDCSCESDYIKFHTQKKCRKCGFGKDDSPDSRLVEVVDKLIENSELLEDPNEVSNGTM